MSVMDFLKKRSFQMVNDEPNRQQLQRRIEKAQELR